jgi:DNA-directed RNA polymerase alpha subunit
MGQDGCANTNPAAEHDLQHISLPKRALNALLRGGIRTLEEAAEWSDRDLLSLPHFGPASVASLRRLIGLHIAG